jgi:exosortase A
MPPDLARQPWRAALLRLTIAWLALAGLFASDWLAMADQWWNSSTYNHILLIPPIIGWLVWLRVPQLQRLTPTIWWPGLIAAVLACFIWVLGTFAGFNLIRQIGAVALLPAAALLLLGPKVCAGLIFPLGYMAFLVPFGDELIPPLQTITARLTVALTHLSGIPAQINGVFIDTPAGLFEVAEACSGVKFLIAMAALGVLAANVCFISNARRAGFMALAIAAPILANGVRAWGTIYVAQFKGVAYAGGVDHIIYGWIFFAMVIALVLALSWRFFDRAAGDLMIDAAAIAASPQLARLEKASLGWIAGLVGLFALVLGGQAWARVADRQIAAVPSQLALPVVAGWHRVDYHPEVWWEPRAGGADHRLLGRYEDASGRKVDVFYALYSAQREGREAGGYGEGALRPDGPWSWTADGLATPHAKAERLIAAGRIERLAETYYRTGALLTGSNIRLKLANIEDRLLLRPRPTMMLILSAEGNRPEASLAAFRHAAGPLDAWMDRMARLR